MYKSIEILTLALIPGFIVADLMYRNRRFDTTRWWRLRALLVTVASFFWAGVVAGFWAKLIGDRSLLNLSGLGGAGGAIVGILVYELIHYWYHRLAHGWDPLWRV